MIYKSARTSLTDAYRAGSEIGEALKDIAPEVILIFASITFDSEYPAFFEGLYDGLERRDLIVFGGTGDGIYETGTTLHYGVCALGFASGGRTKWSAVLETGAGADSPGTARRCAALALGQLGDEAQWALVLADGVSADGTGIVSGARQVLPCPFIGGMTGDDRKFTRSRIFLNGRAVADGVGILLASGAPPFSVHTVSGFLPIGAPGTVEASQGKTIRRVGGQTPLAFVRNQIGTPLAEADHGVLAFATYPDPAQDRFYMRASARFDAQTESITLFGSIPEGASIRVSSITRERLLHAVTECMEKVTRSGFTPAAAIIISCAGRKWQLNSRGQEEVQAFQDAVGRQVPLVGFPSFGEIGPYLKEDASYTAPFFHNVSLVICLLGA